MCGLWINESVIRTPRDHTINCVIVPVPILYIQWKPVIRTSSGVEKNVLITGMFL